MLKILVLSYLFFVLFVFSYFILFFLKVWSCIQSVIRFFLKKKKKKREKNIIFIFISSIQIIALKFVLFDFDAGIFVRLETCGAGILYKHEVVDFFLRSFEQDHGNLFSLYTTLRFS